jgi:ABC-2 type transport system ATP-binding protein
VLVADIRNLTVKYGQFTALRDFSAQIPTGCIGLLGPNGAGKTTLIKTLLGFVTPAAGQGHVFDLDIRTQARQIRQRVGLMPEQDCHIPGLTAVQFVAYAGELAGMPKDQALRRAHEVLEYCGLGEARYRNVETYSTGMKQRIKLAQALVHGPKLLLLDEPTNGLDPAGREQMLELIRSISHGKNVNVIVSSHLLPDVERVCDQVVLIAQGQIRGQGEISALKQIEGRPIDVELREPSEAFLEVVARNGFALLERRTSGYRLQGQGDFDEQIRTIFRCAAEANAQVRGVQAASKSLEEAFLAAVR